jgi:hypothetical protein
MEKKLHAYELGILTDAERERFEMHIFECDECFKKAADFRKTSSLLRWDTDVRRTVKEIVPADAVTTVVRSSWLRPFDILLRDTPRLLLLKPILIAAVFCLLAYPAYKYWLEPETRPAIQQTINLYPTRGAGENTIELSHGGYVEINFVFERAVPHKSYPVRIASEDGIEVYSESAYSGFTPEGMGTIILPIELLSAGRYTLTITDPPAEEPDNQQVYYIQVL